jgi:hypothetical protein
MALKMGKEVQDLYRALYRERLAADISAHGRLVPIAAPPTPEEIAEQEQRAAAQLERDREEWRRTEAVFVVYEYGGCCADDAYENDLSWLGSEDEADTEVARMEAANPADDYAWRAIPKGRGR